MFILTQDVPLVVPLSQPGESGTEASGLCCRETVAIPIGRSENAQALADLEAHKKKDGTFSLTFESSG
jgi:hypothetical protein